MGSSDNTWEDEEEEEEEEEDEEDEDDVECEWVEGGSIV